MKRASCVSPLRRRSNNGRHRSTTRRTSRSLSATGRSRGGDNNNNNNSSSMNGHSLMSASGKVPPRLEPLRQSSTPPSSATDTNAAQHRRGINGESSSAEGGLCNNNNNKSTPDFTVNTSYDEEEDGAADVRASSSSISPQRVSNIPPHPCQSYYEHAEGGRRRPSMISTVESILSATMHNKNGSSIHHNNNNNSHSPLFASGASFVSTTSLGKVIMDQQAEVLRQRKSVQRSLQGHPAVARHQWPLSSYNSLKKKNSSNPYGDEEEEGEDGVHNHTLSSTFLQETFSNFRKSFLLNPFTSSSGGHTTNHNGGNDLCGTLVSTLFQQTFTDFNSTFRSSTNNNNNNNNNNNQRHGNGSEEEEDEDEDLTGGIRVEEAASPWPYHSGNPLLADEEGGEGEEGGYHDQEGNNTYASPLRAGDAPVVVVQPVITTQQQIQVNGDTTTTFSFAPVIKCSIPVADQRRAPSPPHRSTWDSSNNTNVNNSNSGRSVGYRQPTPLIEEMGMDEVASLSAAMAAI